jgi:predicted nucleic acid-binding Zn ribbon protein
LVERNEDTTEPADVTDNHADAATSISRNGLPQSLLAELSPETLAVLNAPSVWKLKWFEEDNRLPPFLWEREWREKTVRWCVPCRAAGQPLCAFTHQPLAGGFIEYRRLAPDSGSFVHAPVSTGQELPPLLPRGGDRRSPQVIAAIADRVLRWYLHLGFLPRLVTILDIDIPDREQLQPCPVCAARFLKDCEGTCSGACTAWCYLERERRKRRTRYAEWRGDVQRQCASCSQPFTVVRTDQSFCSGACRQRAYRQRKAAP